MTSRKCVESCPADYDLNEDNTNQILHDLTAIITPRYMSVIGYWKVRGGIVTTITTKYIKLSK